MTTFEEAAEKVKKLKGSPSQDDMLLLYALFKQANVGDNNTDKPGMLDMKGKAKWSAWDEKKGMSKDDAKKQYVALAEKLIAKHGLA